MNRIDDIAIERFLDGSMSEPERAAFSARMAADRALSRRVAAEESTMRAMREDRDASQRDHSRVRSRVLASIPNTAPAGGSLNSAESGDRGRWPLIGTVLFLVTWVAIDFVGVEKAESLIGIRSDSSRVNTAKANDVNEAIVNSSAPGSATTTASPGVPEIDRANSTSTKAELQGAHSMRALPQVVVAAKPSPTAARARATEHDAKSYAARSASLIRGSKNTKTSAAATVVAVPKSLAKRTDSVARTTLKIGE